MHRGHYWCASITVPLLKKEVMPLPTEIIKMKQLELYKLFDQMNKMMKVSQLVTRVRYVDKTWLMKCMNQYQKSYSQLKYGLLMDKTFLSRKKMKTAVNAVTTLMNIEDLLKSISKNKNKSWENLLTLYLWNIQRFNIIS